MKTEEIFKKIYQDLKEETLKNTGQIFLKEYEIPSINYRGNNEQTEDMYFASGIEMQLEQMMKYFDYKVFYSSYKEKYFFSNSTDKVKQRVITEIEREINKERKEKLFAKVEGELANFKEELRQKTPDEIIEKAYELTVKKGIIGQLKEINLDNEELIALIEKNDLLSDFYENWMENDGKLDDILYYGMTEEIELIVNEYNKEISRKSQEVR